MTVWKNLENEECYAVAVYNYTSSSQHHLQLEVGELVHLQRETSHWYWGTSLRAGTSGAFPKTYVVIRDCTVDRCGDAVVASAGGRGVVHDIAVTLREWLKDWKKLYITNSEHFKFMEVSMRALLELRAQAASSALPQDQLRKVARTAIFTIDKGNRTLDMELAVRTPSGQLVDPLTISTYKLNALHDEANARLDKNMEGAPGGAGAGGGGAARAGLAGAYALLLPAYLAHVAKCRADLHLQLAALERILSDTRMPQEDYREDCPIPSGWQRNGKIEFENVTVQHNPDSSPILKNINLTVNPGEKLAICGRSGSGKSTLVLTCAGAAPVRGGRVLVDGAAAGAVPLRALRHRVLVLPQEGALFSGTLRENLDPLAVHTDDEIWQCLKAVGLYEFVTAQSAGLECPVGGARGARWSGGRGARACAARAALHARFAAALLLDEPAAALDAHAERDLLAALASAAPNTTLITVSHRLSSVRGYDRAAVMEEGRIVELGSMRSLLAQPSSRLARMFAATNQTH